MTRKATMKFSLFAATIMAAAFAATAAHGGLLTGDPRKCPAGDARYCAQAAAVATIRDVMAKREGVTKWNDHLTCRPAMGSLLRWRCDHIDTHHNVDTITVTFRATSAGWKRVVTVAMTP